MTLSRLLPLAALGALLVGCNPDDRVDGDNPQHTDSDDYEQDIYDARTGAEGAEPLAMPEDTLAVDEALGDVPGQE